MRIEATLSGNGSMNILNVQPVSNLFFPTQRKAFIMLVTQGTENNANSQIKPVMI